MAQLAAMRRAALVLVSTAACTTIDHGAPPLRPDTSDAASNCYYQSRVALVPGSGDATLAGGGGGSFTYGGITPWYTTFRMGPGGSTSSAHASVRGWSFYHGDSLLDARDGLELIGGASLIARYDASLEPYASGAYSRWARPLWIVLLGSGIALATAGAIVAAGVTPDPETGVSDLGAPLALLGGGVGGLLVSIPFLWLDLGNQTEAAELTMREALFVPDDVLAPEVDAAVARFNGDAARRCGFAPP